MSDEDEPLGDVAADVERRREQPTDDVFEEAFDEMDVEVDAEAVWEQLEDEAGGPGDFAQAGEERVVEKQSYCQRCRYFAEPPEVGCHHEGTEILELVDVDHFRVVDCPVVRERERLEGLD